MGLFGGKRGVCYLTSKTVPQWNFEVQVESLLVTSVMMGVYPREFEVKLAEKKEELGDPPEDTEIYCIKD